MKDLLRVENLSAGYGGRDVIRDISFTLKSGELCALLGSNGSGKSTLLRALCALLKTRGRVEVDGNDISVLSQRERAKNVGYLAQRRETALSLTALDVVLMGFNPVLGPLRSPGTALHRQAAVLLEWAGIGDLANRDIRTLSEGQKQLVLFARTMVCSPALVVLDEPDSTLDFRNRNQILRLLTDYLARGKRSVLLCSHDVNTALSYADHLLLLKGGTLAYDLAAERLSKETLEAALRDVYGPVEVIEHKGKYLMIGGEA